MGHREKYCMLYYDAELLDPFYLRARINGKNPYDERVMSMPQLLDGVGQIQCAKTLPHKIGNYFFFIFNFENYYHFLYDTLPYLNFYFLCAPRPKLLLPKGHVFLKFQKEMLMLLGIDLENDIEYAEEAIYSQLHVPSSLTHGHTFSGESASNNPPERDAHIIWQALKNSVPHALTCTPKRFYVSRRSHIHGDNSNIGTNYTTRRRCLNEDAVVALLQSYGYEEVFSELMSSEQKIATFKNATHIVGFIGGGMANALFSPTSTFVGTILTPEFLRINARFIQSMNHTKLNILDITRLAPHSGDFPLYTRVQVKAHSSLYFNKIGEIHEYKDDKYKVHLSNQIVAGFSLDAKLLSVEFSRSEIEPLDGGLNSPFVCDVDALKVYLESLETESKAV
jgi:hypothetical protein